MKSREVFIPSAMSVTSTVSFTRNSVEEIFAVPETKRLWEELRDSRGFQKIASKLRNLEKATKEAIVREAKKMAINEGKTFNEAVQERIMYYKNEVYGSN